MIIRKWSLVMNWHNGRFHQRIFRHRLCVIKIIFYSWNESLLQLLTALHKPLLLNTGF